MRKKLMIFGLSLALVLGMILVSLGDIPLILPIDLFLNSIADVNAGNPSDNDALTYDSGTRKWIPEAIAAGVSEEDLAYLDNFDDASRHWGWTDDAQNGTITEAGELLTLSIGNAVNGGLAGGQNTAPRCYMGDPGSPFEVKVKLNSYTVNNSSQVGIFITDKPSFANDNNWMLFGRTKHDGVGVDGLAVTNFAGAYAHSNGITTLPIYLRCRVTNMAISADAKCEIAYSTDDETYTVMGTISLNGFSTTGQKINMTMGIFARNRIDAAACPAVDAPFEWYKMTRSLGPR